MVEQQRRNELFAAFALLLVIGATIASNVLTLSDRMAIGGWSPTDWVNHLFHPSNFVNDFPSGIDNYGRSLFLLLYPAMYQWLGVSPESLAYVVIGCEVALLGFTSMWLCRTLLPAEGPEIAAIVGIIAISGCIALADLSQIASPFFVGLFYNMADCARLGAIIFVLKRRWIIAAVLLALSTATHPIMGALGAVFIGILSLSMCWEEKSKLWRPLLVYVGLAGAWVVGSTVGSTALNAGTIPQEEWLAYTRLFSYHWYPFQYGMLTDFGGEHLLPLLGFAVLFYHFLPAARLSPAVERGWQWGMAALLFLVTIGVLVPTFFPVPLLVKLNLTRASHLALWIGFPIVVLGLTRAIMSGPWWERITAGVLLLSPFLSTAAIPALVVLLAVARRTIAVVRNWKSEGAHGKMVAVMAAAFGAVAGWSWLGGYRDSISLYFLGDKTVWVLALLLAAVFVVSKKEWSSRAGVVVMLVVFGAALLWVKNDYETTANVYRKGADFRQAQLWAKRATSKDALFMVDPVISYGWRDFSQRSSFGNVREWLHTSWLYDSQLGNYCEGKRRFAELGVDIGPYLNAYPSLPRLSALMSQVKERFYTLDDEWRISMARRYGIDYFVMERNHLGVTELPRVFENASYVILQVLPQEGAGLMPVERRKPAFDRGCLGGGKGA